MADESSLKFRDFGYIPGERDTPYAKKYFNYYCIHNRHYSIALRFRRLGR